ncbi:hypothetical protein SISNIDRAFT_394712, partial [Sistotremastrum niveocremeum HHB9708]
MPNPWRQYASGLEMESIPIIINQDDMSGNNSTQWNVHYSVYMSLAGLPRKEIEKMMNIHFVSTSPHASPMELIEAVCDMVNRSAQKKPWKIWDQRRHCHIYVIPWIIFASGDNPMQSELCSHIGMNGNKKCRMCHVGAPEKVLLTDDGFLSLFEPGTDRKCSETKQAIQDQLEMSLERGAETHIKDHMSKTGVKDTLAHPLITRLVQLGKAYRKPEPDKVPKPAEEIRQLLLDERDFHDWQALHNSFLDADGFDPHTMTPVETLHTVLLGIVKYFWGQSMEIMEKANHFDILRTRFRSLREQGMKIPKLNGDYMIKYKGALIGKHFKSVAQLMVFVCEGLVPESVYNAWVIIGHLTALIWQTEYDDIKQFTDELRETIAKLMDATAACAPSILISKPKFHILVHLPEHVLKFGPPVLTSTERYEAFNHIFRLCSTHSNRQAPSRDIATSFADFDRCRHVMMGGYWWDEKEQRARCAHSNVSKFLAEEPVAQECLGISVTTPTVTGELVCKPGDANGETQHTANILALRQHVNDSTSIPTTLLNVNEPWEEYLKVTVQNGDQADLSSHVLLLEPTPRFAAVKKILSSCNPHGHHETVLVLAALDLQPGRHPKTHLPVLHLAKDEIIAMPHEIALVVNTQHDCMTLNCHETVTVKSVQEREQTTVNKKALLHKTDPHFILNLHCLHNRAAIIKALRSTHPHLATIPTFYSDRLKHRRDCAAALRRQKRTK